MFYLAGFEAWDRSFAQGLVRVAGPRPGARPADRWWQAWRDVVFPKGALAFPHYALRLVITPKSLDRLLIIPVPQTGEAGLLTQLDRLHALNSILPGSVEIPAARARFDALLAPPSGLACLLALPCYHVADHWLACRFPVLPFLEHFIDKCRDRLTFPLWYQINVARLESPTEYYREARKNGLRLREIPGMPSALLEAQDHLATALRSTVAFGEEILQAPDTASAELLRDEISRAFFEVNGRLGFEAPDWVFAPECCDFQLASGFHRAAFRSLKTHEICAEALDARICQDMLGWQPGPAFFVSPGLVETAEPLIETAAFAVSEAAAEAADRPRLRIVAPLDRQVLSQPSVTVQLVLDCESSQADTLEISVRVNEHPACLTRDIMLTAKSELRGQVRVSKQVTLLPGRNRITAWAQCRDLPWPPVSVTVEYLGQDAVAALYVLSIGVSQYVDPQLHLPAAAGDARRLGEAFQTYSRNLFRRVEVRQILDQMAVRDDILDGLEWLEQSVTQHDVAVIYVAGHGACDRVGDYYFLPHEAQPARLRHTAILWTDFEKTVRHLSGRTLFLVDTCHAGASTGSGEFSRGVRPIEDYLRDLAAPQSGKVVMAATTGQEVALESSLWGGGAFTTALVDGLAGAADAMSKDGVIYLKEWDAYVTQRVKELTQGRQHATTQLPINLIDFPLARFR